MYSSNKMERPQKQKQDEHDNNGEVPPPPLKKLMEDEKSSPTLKDNEDLLGVLGNDVVFGEVMTRLPWYNLPVLKMLSRSWAHAFTHSFPPYARCHHPRILSKLIVLFRSPFPNYPSDSEDDLALWLYSFDRPHLMWNLPVPPIPVHLHKHVKFLCDDNDECIYSICVLEKGLFDVHVLDLREGICSGWKRLPSLQPVDIDHYVYSCSSTSIVNGNGSTTAQTISMRKTLEADPKAFSHWTLTDSEDKWECQRVSSKPLAFDSEEEKPPFYVEIERHSDTHSRPLKCLFQRCERLDDSEPPALLWGNRYIIMFQEDTVVSRGYNFYEIRIYNDSVELHRMKLKESSIRVTEDEEGRRFWDFWQERIGIYGFNLPEEGKEETVSVIKVSEERVEMGVEGHGNDYVQVAQRSRSLYLYRLTGSYYDDQN